MFPLPSIDSIFPAIFFDIGSGQRKIREDEELYGYNLVVLFIPPPPPHSDEASGLVFERRDNNQWLMLFALSESFKRKLDGSREKGKYTLGG